MKPLKHAKVIKAWADGAKIQWYDSSPREHRWKDCPDVFLWQDRFEFRLKPEPKPDVVRFVVYEWNPAQERTCGGIPDQVQSSFSNLKLTFDGETGKLKAAEVL
jgi:hypothetical protein